MNDPRVFVGLGGDFDTESYVLLSEYRSLQRRIEELEAVLRVMSRENLELKYENQELSCSSIMARAANDHDR